MNNAIRRSCSILFMFVLSMSMCLLLSNTLVVNAAEAPGCVQFDYMNQYATTPAGENENIVNTANVKVTLSDNSLGEGTVVTLTGIPTDSIYFQGESKYSVVFSEGDDVTKTYGGWYGGETYDDGIISYTVQTDVSNLKIDFGDWQMKDGAGRDACCTINADGSIDTQ